MIFLSLFTFFTILQYFRCKIHMSSFLTQNTNTNENPNAIKFNLYRSPSNQFREEYLADPSNLALYMFTYDSPGLSRCYDKCAENWPPATTSEPRLPILQNSTLNFFQKIKRNDTNKPQLTYNNWPLYYYENDDDPGQITGQGVNHDGGLWLLLNATGFPIYPIPNNNFINSTNNDKYGNILVGNSNYTLYVFTEDQPGISTCNVTCSKIWPPLVALPEVPPVAGTGVLQNMLGVTNRTDGRMQVTFNGMPLYYYSEDDDPLEFNGQALDNKWFVISPTGEVIKKKP